MNTILDNYLQELEIFGLSITKKLSPSQRGEKICSDLEKSNQKKLKDVIEKKCGKIPIASIEKSICELKNQIYYTNELIFDLMKNKYRCKRRSSCFIVINNKIYELKQDLRDFNNDLKQLEKEKKQK